MVGRFSTNSGIRKEVGDNKINEDFEVINRSNELRVAIQRSVIRTYNHEEFKKLC